MSTFKNTTFYSETLGYEVEVSSLRQTLITMYRGFVESELASLCEPHELANITNDFLALQSILQAEI